MSVSLTVFVSMVHCRTPLGAWKHAHRSYKRGYASRPPVFYGEDFLPPPAPPVFLGVEFSGIRNRSNWNDLCDKSEDLDMTCPTLDILETCCPAGVVTYFLDAPIITKDISRPTVLCLSDLLEPVADGITGDFMELPPTNDGILELPGEKLLQALHDMKQDLKLALEIERAAIQKTFEEDVVDLAGFKEQITDRVMAEVVDMLPTPGKPLLDPHQLSFAERRQMFSSRMAATVEPEEQHCNSNIGNEFIWNSNATEFSPIFVDFIAAGPGHCKGDDASLQVGADYRDSATDSVFELVYSEQSRLKRYCFKRTEYLERLEPKCHKVMYSNQDKMKRYSFMKHEQVLSAVVYSDEECARIRFNLLNDDCMKLTEEELFIFNNLSARSASWHDKDGIDDSCKYNACFSDILPFSSDVPLCNDHLVHFTPPACAACSSAVLDFV